MSLMQRNKGKRFERQIATALRAVFPDAVVRRASQADRAHQSDVYVTGGPPLLSRLWLECQDARNPTPLVKLEQAERDCGETGLYGLHNSHRLPVVIWHKLGAREIYATMRLWTLDAIRYIAHHTPPHSSDVVVTMTLGELLAIVANVPHATQEAA